MGWRSLPRGDLALAFLAGLSLLLACPAAHADPVDPSTLEGKMIMGYQGWFACPGDAAGRGWVHWKDGQNQVTVDMLPDVSELSPSELCDSGLVARDGKPVSFFSDMNPKTVDRHFQWMETYGIDGVALQRFASVLLHPEILKASDAVLANVRAGAEGHGRVFFLMYDLSGMPPAKLQLVADDWRRLVAQGLTHSRAYLSHKGHPVLGLWGVGFNGRDLSPAQFDAFLTQVKAASEAAGGVTVLGGVPAGWREGRGDASADPGWKTIWPKLDVISPWTVGRYKDDAGVDKYREGSLKPDLAAAKAMGVDYMPVVFPGFSWSNLMRARHNADKAIPNQIPRRCGAFYWRQVANAAGSGASMLYTAMFDEVDEGTAMFKLDADASASPRDPSFVTLDADKCDVESDWYLRLGGAVHAAFGKRGAWPPFPFEIPASR
jgi:hypothetical protein